MFEEDWKNIDDERARQAEISKTDFLVTGEACETRFLPGEGFFLAFEDVGEGSTNHYPIAPVSFFCFCFSK